MDISDISKTLLKNSFPILDHLVKLSHRINDLARNMPTTHFFCPNERTSVNSEGRKCAISNYFNNSPQCFESKQELLIDIPHGEISNFKQVKVLHPLTDGCILIVAGKIQKFLPLFLSWK